MTDAPNPREAFIHAATWHGDLAEAEALLAAHPHLASSDIHTAAILGDDAGVRRFLAADPSNATAKSPPHGGDALTYLCLSKYLRLDPKRSDAFLRAATALLDAGADTNAGFWTTGDHPEFETALYGAAGVAFHAPLTHLLLARGANPNDEETPYHSPEGPHNEAVKALLESGKLTEESLGMMLLRKTDWHDYDGVKLLLEYGVNPNLQTRWGKTALHNSLLSDNGLPIIELLLDHGADPLLLAERADRWDKEFTGHSSVSIAARRGRRDALELFEQRGFSVALEGVEKLIAACARHDAATAQSIAANEPQLLRELLAMGGKLLAEFAGTWNTEGVRILLDLGVPVTAPYAGDAYYDTAPQATALHVAAWRGVSSTVQLLLERGAPVNAADAKGRTPLMLAVKACVDSYWTHRRTPEAVAALLAAGASTAGVKYPCGYAEVDALLKSHREK